MKAAPIQIGILAVFDSDYEPNMQDAYESDMEMGSHHMNNAHSEEFAKKYPTISAMAHLIERERDYYKRVVELVELGADISALKEQAKDEI